jgi:hypothetical protein
MRAPSWFSTHLSSGCPYSLRGQVRCVQSGEHPSGRSAHCSHEHSCILTLSPTISARTLRKPQPSSLSPRAPQKSRRRNSIDNLSLVSLAPLTRAPCACSGTAAPLHYWAAGSGTHTPPSSCTAASRAAAVWPAASSPPAKHHDMSTRAHTHTHTHHGSGPMHSCPAASREPRTGLAVSQTIL